MAGNKWLGALLIIWFLATLGLSVAFRLWLGVILSIFMLVVIIPPFVEASGGTYELPSCFRMSRSQQIAAAISFVVIPFAVWRILMDGFPASIVGVFIVVASILLLTVVIRREGWSGRKPDSQ